MTEEAKQLREEMARGCLAVLRDTDRNVHMVDVRAALWDALDPLVLRLRLRRDAIDIAASNAQDHDRAAMLGKLAEIDWVLNLLGGAP